MCVRVFECIFACIPLSGTEGSCGLVVRHTLGFDAFSVVIIHHLVRNFCQNTLSQCSWRGLETQRKRRRRTRRRRRRRYILPAMHDYRMLEFTFGSDGLDR